MIKTILIFMILFLLFIIPQINSYFSYEEINSCIIPTQLLLEKGWPSIVFGDLGSWSPSLVLYIQALGSKIFGTSDWSLRIFAVFFNILQIPVFFMIGKQLFRRYKDIKIFLFIASILFITNPATIQGTLLITEDNILYPFLVSLFTLFFIRFENKRSYFDAIILSLIFTLSLWAKFSNAAFIPLSVLIYYLVKRDIKGLFLSIIIFLCSTSMFLISWSIYCSISGMPVLGPLNYSSSAFMDRLFPKKLDSITLGFVANILRFICWIGFYSILLWIIGVTKLIQGIRKKDLSPVAILAMFAIFLGATYFIAGGLTYGFPRYQYPMLSAMSIFSAFMFKDHLRDLSKKDFVVYASITSLLFLFYYLVVKDLVYIVNFSLREAAVTSFRETKNTILYFSYKYILYLLPYPAVFLFLNYYKNNMRLMKKIIISIFIMIFATNISMDIIQLKADYLTRFCYGEKGTGELIEYLDKRITDSDIVLAPNDIIYYLKKKGNIIPYPRTLSWYGEYGQLIETMKDDSAKFFIYSIGHNDIRQYKEICCNPVLNNELNQDFIYKRIGTYSVWQRRSY